MNNRNTIKCLLYFAVSYLIILSAATAQANLWSYHTFKNAKGDSLRYRQLQPDYNTVRKLPLVVFLHGSGERGSDNEAQLKWGVHQFASDKNMTLHPAFVIAPQCPANSNWANISNWSRDSLIFATEPSKTMALLKELIDQTILRFPIDTQRIYITGLSMGGFGTFDAITRYPNLFAAAVPVCGGGDISKVTSIRHIPMWIVTGAEDSAVSPVLSIEMTRALQKAGAHPGYTQYPEVGHFSWIMAYQDAMIMEWLFRQRK